MISCVLHELSIPSFLFHHLNRILKRVHFTKILIAQFSPASCHFFSPYSKYPPHTLLSNTINICTFLDVTHQASHPHKVATKIHVRVF